MYPIGILFGLGFDTATEVALLFLAAGAAGAGLPWYAILCLPILFAAGMSLLDTIDGSFMNFAYGWAFSQPVRKVYYNLTITGPLGGGRADHRDDRAGRDRRRQLGATGAFWLWIENIDLNTLGYVDRRDVRGHLGRGAGGLALRAHRGAVERAGMPIVVTWGAMTEAPRVERSRSPTSPRSWRRCARAGFGCRRRGDSCWRRCSPRTRRCPPTGSPTATSTSRPSTATSRRSRRTASCSTCTSATAPACTRWSGAASTSTSTANGAARSPPCARASSIPCGR